MNLTVSQLFFTALVLGGCSSTVRRDAPQIQASPPIVQKPLAAASPVKVLDHGYFKVHYDQNFGLAKYVIYQVTRDQLKAGKAKRKERFVTDPLVTRLKLKMFDARAYVKSNYDKGHLAPARDFAYSQDASDKTFVMSNMAPQTPNLNRSAWRLLEERVRRMGCGEGKITVITGPILEPGLKKLPNGLPIPNEFFKVVIDETPPRKAIAFLYTQRDRGEVSNQRIVPLLNIEQKLNESFFSEGPERIPASSAAENPWLEEAC